MSAEIPKTCRAVFLDKDGTLIEDVPYNVDPARIRFTSGAADAVRFLHDAGFRLIVITNQSGVARGLFPISALTAVQSRIEAMMREVGAPADAFYFCPHLPEGTVAEYARSCTCRKPAPGLILQAAAEHNIDLTKSWVIGDKRDDVEAGRRAGCRTVLIGQPSPDFHSDAIAPDLPSAARYVLSASALHSAHERKHGHD